MGLLERLREAAALPSARLDTQVWRACLRQRSALSEMGSSLGIWAGIGDRRLVEKAVDSKIAAYLDRASEQGASYGRVMGLAGGVVLIFLVAIVGVAVQL